MSEADTDWLRAVERPTETHSQKATTDDHAGTVPEHAAGSVQGGDSSRDEKAHLHN